MGRPPRQLLSEALRAAPRSLARYVLPIDEATVDQRSLARHVVGIGPGEEGHKRLFEGDGVIIRDEVRSSPEGLPGDEFVQMDPSLFATPRYVVLPDPEEPREPIDKGGSVFVLPDFYGFDKGSLMRKSHRASDRIGWARA